MTDRQIKSIVKLRRLLQRPCTMARLMAKLGVSDRTVYRYLDMLSAEGYQVERSGRGYPVKFLIN